MSILKMIADAAESVAKFGAGTVSTGLTFQPKTPACLSDSKDAE